MDLDRIHGGFVGLGARGTGCERVVVTSVMTWRLVGSPDSRSRYQDFLVSHIVSRFRASLGLDRINGGFFLLGGGRDRIRASDRYERHYIASRGLS